jgi:hypothetical protein
VEFLYGKAPYFEVDPGERGGLHLQMSEYDARSSVERVAAAVTIGR